jgi:hypothetical protein
MFLKRQLANFLGTDCRFHQSDRWRDLVVHNYATRLILRCQQRHFLFPLLSSWAFPDIQNYTDALYLGVLSRDSGIALHGLFLGHRRHRLEKQLSQIVTPGLIEALVLINNYFKDYHFLVKVTINAPVKSAVEPDSS